MFETPPTLPTSVLDTNPSTIAATTTTTEEETKRPLPIVSSSISASVPPLLSSSSSDVTTTTISLQPPLPGESTEGSRTMEQQPDDEDDDDDQPPQSQAPSITSPIPATTILPAYKFSAYLKGRLDPQTREWVGYWASTESGCDDDQSDRQKFFYRPTKRPGHLQSLILPPTQVSTLRLTGHYDTLVGGKLKAIPESNVTITFTPVESKPGEFTVTGRGKNDLGYFDLRGMYDSSSNDTLSTMKSYLLGTPKVDKPLSAKKAAKRAAALAIPLSTPFLGTANVNASSSSSLIVPDKPPARFRRTPSYLADSELDLGSSSTKEADLSAIARIVDKIAEKDKSSFFQSPVDPVALNIPDYFTQITHPMDLGTIKTKLASHEYQNEEQLIQDVKLTFHNAMSYNNQHTLVHIEASHLLKMFEKELSSMRSLAIGTRKRMTSSGAGSAVTGVAGGAMKKKGRKGGRPSKVPSDMYVYSGGGESEDMMMMNDDDEDGVNEDNFGKRPLGGGQRKSMQSDEVLELRRQLEQVSNQVRNLQQQQATSPRSTIKPKGRASGSNPSAASGGGAAASIDLQPIAVGLASSSSMITSDRQLSYQEKRALGQDIHKLPADQVYRVIEIIHESGIQMGGDDQEVEIDIEKLNTETLRKLQKFTREVLRLEKKKAVRDAAF